MHSSHNDTFFGLPHGEIQNNCGLGNQGPLLMPSCLPGVGVHHTVSAVLVVSLFWNKPLGFICAVLIPWKVLSLSRILVTFSDSVQVTHLIFLRQIPLFAVFSYRPLPALWHKQPHSVVMIYLFVHFSHAWEKGLDFPSCNPSETAEWVWLIEKSILKS